MTPLELNNLLVGDIESVVSYLLPNGIKKGHEYLVGSVNGEPGSSMAVRFTGGKAGVWKDFADDTGGGDLIDLWVAVKNISFVDALKEIKDFLGVVDDENKFYKKKKKYNLPKRPECTCANKKVLSWLSGRGISNGTVEKLKIAQHGDAILFPFLSPDGVLELAKYRAIAEKKFWSNEDPIPCLFGWQAIGPDVVDVVICEGEIDCLTFFEQGISALSVPKGAGGGGKQDWIEYEYERLERFKNIYISMDSDSAGDIAKGEIISRLGRHRCKIVNLSAMGVNYKDANEVHLSGGSLALYLDCAMTEDPEELKQLGSFHDEIMKGLTCSPEDSPGMNLPWGKSMGLIKIRPGEVSVWAGINSHGKSLVLSNVIIDGISQGEKFCVASMEMPPADLGEKMYRHSGFFRGISNDESEQIASFIDSGLWIINTYGSTKFEKIIEVFRYARKRYGVGQFVIDSLAKCGLSEEDYSGQKQIVDDLQDFALKYNVHVHLVHHARKQQSEDDIPNKFSIKGTGAIIDMVANAFIVWRNKKKEELMESGDRSMVDKFDMILDCVKQKKTGKEPRLGFMFEPSSLQFVERAGDPPRKYVYFD